ncbi:MAG: VIT1/CCC1 transporter family protein [Bacteroidota bacterium]
MEEKETHQSSSSDSTRSVHQENSWIHRYQEFLSEFVYGGIDGSVTTFAVVAGSAGANLDSSIIIILGFANLIADGFSMSVGSYLSNKSETENFEKHEQIEYWEIENIPESEREEIRKIYRDKGFEGELLEDVVSVITSDKDRWVDVMMKEELGMMQLSKSPLAMGLVTFFSFIIVGFIPLLIYVIDYFTIPPMNNLFGTSILLTSIAFIFIGLLKAIVNEKSILKGVGETLLLGSAAAILAYYVGNFLEKII